MENVCNQLREQRRQIITRHLNILTRLSKHLENSITADKRRSLDVRSSCLDASHVKHYEQQKSESFCHSLTNPQLVGKGRKILIPASKGRKTSRGYDQA
jgi:hypothetical protein